RLLQRRETATPWADAAIRRTFEEAWAATVAFARSEAARARRARDAWAAAWAARGAEHGDVVRLRAAVDAARRTFPAAKSTKPFLCRDAIERWLLGTTTGDAALTSGAGTDLCDGGLADATAGSTFDDAASAALAALKAAWKPVAQGRPAAPPDPPAAPSDLDRAAFEREQALGRLYLAARDAYRAAAIEEERIDFQGLLEEAARLLDDPATKARFAGRFRHLLVDEFQDTDALQWSVFRRLFAREDGRLRAGLLLVGDEKQAVYGFRGGDVAVFRRACEEIAASWTPGVRPLPDNYRSAPGLVEFVNRVFDATFARPGAAEPFEARSAPMTPLRDGAAPSESRILWRRVVDDDPDEGDVDDEGAEAGGAVVSAEARAAVDAVRRVIEENWQVGDADAPGGRRPARYADVAVLLRTRGLSPDLERAFEESGIPYRVAGGVGLYARREIRDLVAALSCLVDPDDDVALLATARSALCGLPDSTLLAARRAWLDAGGGRGRPWLRRGLELAAARAAAEPGFLPTPSDAPTLRDAVVRLERWRRLAGRVPTSDLTAAIVAESDFAMTLAVVDPSGRSAANVDRFVDLLRAAERTGDAAPESTVRRVRAAVEDEHVAAQADPPADGRDAVLVLTEHAAKGLEWPVVVVPGLGQDVLKAGGFGEAAPPLRADGDAPPWFSWNLVDDGLTPEKGAAPWVHRLTSRRRDDERQAEQKRLFYVSLTRARDHLVFVERAAKRAAPRASRSRWLSDALGPLELGDERTFEARGTRARLTVEAASPKAPPPPAAPAPPRFDGAPPPAEIAAPRLRLSAPASATATLARCPRRFFLEQGIGAPTESAGQTIAVASDGVDPRLRGLVVHAALEAASLGRDPTARARAAAAEVGVRDAASVDALVELAEKAVAGFRAWDLGARAWSAPKTDLAVEAAFAFDAGPLRFFGRADLVFRDRARGVTVVVDYKTSAPKSPAAARRAVRDGGYAEQLAVYAAAVRRAYGDPVEGWVYFTGSGLSVLCVGDAPGAIRDPDAALAALACGRDGPADVAYPLTDDPATCRDCPHLFRLCPGAAAAFAADTSSS
ncbi:MAG TPA: 3'-5' exonuclease, partial [Planctomycetota bacterium]|nr:3'-5' exonuclease [Planctomycetota bacterium]